MHRLDLHENYFLEFLTLSTTFYDYIDSVFKINFRKTSYQIENQQKIICIPFTYKLRLEYALIIHVNDSLGLGFSFGFAFEVDATFFLYKITPFSIVYLRLSFT